MTAPRWAGLAGAGLFAGAGAWALHQQAGIIIASWSCAKAPEGIWVSGIVAGLLFVGGAIFTGTALRAARSLPEDVGRPRRFLGGISLMASALFLFALVLQVAASFFLPGCVG
jgi:hypothetical protein